MKRLIVFIIVFALFLTFIVFNLDNKCDISFGFKTFKDIPVFLSALFSFALGMLFAVPLIFSLGKGRKKAAGEKFSNLPSSQDGDKKLRGKRNKHGSQTFDEVKHGESSGQDEYSKENGPYGID